MARQRHLNSAPIREALIDFQFDHPVTLDLIEEFSNFHSDKYPLKTDLWQSIIGIEVHGIDAKNNSKVDRLGKRLSSEQHSFILQVRKNGFTVSRLNPYKDWNELKSETLKLWNKFMEIAKIDSVNRVAVRYINELKLPLPVMDFGDYLVCPPEVPKALPQAINGFMTRVVIPSEEDRSEVAVVTQALESNSRDQSNISVILDIDIFKIWDIPISGSLVWSCLDKLREKKNMIFFEHLQERTVELYE